MKHRVRLREARLSYNDRQLDGQDLPTDPFTLCSTWLDEALEHPELIEPNAMTLSTVDAVGQPSARIVLLRGFSEQGCIFYTNYSSRKAHDLQQNGLAALLFYWDRLERELRIEGRVERVSPQESDEYFAQRPRGHRLSAWSSPQSEMVPDRSFLEAAMAAADERFRDVEVPRPAHWGGYLLRPERFEFWQGRADRLHDRMQYFKLGEHWQRTRLAP